MDEQLEGEINLAGEPRTKGEKDPVSGPTSEECVCSLLDPSARIAEQKQRRQLANLPLPGIKAAIASHIIRFTAAARRRCPLLEYIHSRPTGGTQAGRRR